MEHLFLKENIQVRISKIRPKTLIAGTLFNDDSASVETMSPSQLLGDQVRTRDLEPGTTGLTLPAFFIPAAHRMTILLLFVRMYDI